MDQSERSDVVVAVAGRADRQSNLKASEFLEKKRPDAQVAPIVLTIRKNYYAPPTFTHDFANPCR